MVGTDDALCVDSGVVGGCDFDCVFGAEVAVLGVTCSCTLLILRPESYVLNYRCIIQSQTLLYYDPMTDRHDT